MKRGLIICIAIMSFLQSKGQDIHFSNVSYSPLNLNPALVGANHGLRAVVNYRSQWNSVARPYSTFGFSVDSRFNEGRKGYLAMGVNFFNDQAGDERMSTTSASLNAAYHVILEESHKLGGGLYVGFGQRSLKDMGTWSAQFDGTGFNSSLSNQENFEKMNLFHFDMGAGLLYSYEKSKRRSRRSLIQNRINVGAGAYHLNRPNYSFIKVGSEKLAIRFTAFANAVFQVGKSNFALEPGVYYAVQGKSQEIIFGTYGKYVFEGSSRYNSNSDVSVSLGLFYRNKDALITKAMFSWSGLSVGFSYDVNTSNLTAISRSRGGFEFFLQWAMDNPFKGKSRSRWR